MKIQVRIKGKINQYDYHSAMPDDYYGKLREMSGTWQDVETDYLFVNQFNLKELRVMALQVDGIRFIDCTYEDFKKAVRDRYERDWPGCQTHFSAIDYLIENQQDNANT